MRREVPPPRANAEDLFEAEAALREAARNLKLWEDAANKTPAILNQRSKELRAAARRYVLIERELEGSKP